MTITNNFDQSSSGVNLELACFFDTCIAQMDFNENFERVERVAPDGFYGDVYFFTNFGSDVFIENDQRNYKIDCDSKTMIRYMFDYVGGDMREFLLECEINSKDDVNVLLGQFESYLYYESEYLAFLDRYFELDFVVYQTRGYSQGDAATILIDRKTYNENLTQLIDNLVWDAPIYARLFIDGDDFYLDENVNRYDYDKDVMINDFKTSYQGEHKALIVEFLESKLPNYPNYQ